MGQAQLINQRLMEFPDFQVSTAPVDREMRDVAEQFQLNSLNRLVKTETMLAAVLLNT